MVQQAKRMCAQATGTYAIYCIARVDLFEHVHQKALLSLLERSSDSPHRTWILTARHLAHCIPPLRSRAQLVRCPAPVDPRPLRPVIADILNAGSLDDARKTIIDALERGALASELVDELSM